MAGIPNILEAFKRLKVAFPTGLTVIGNAALAGILSGLETLLEKTTPCPCDPELNTRHAAVLFAVPAVIFFVFSLMVLPDSRKLLKCWTGYRQDGQRQDAKARACCYWKQFLFTVITLLKASMPSLIWIILLMLDGDHFACVYQEPGSGPGDTQSGKEICSNNPTPQLSSRCLQSWEIGGISLAAIACLLLILHIARTWKCGNCTLEGYYKAKYNRKLEKALEIKIKENMKEEIKEKIAAHPDVDKRTDDQRPSKTGRKENNPVSSTGEIELSTSLVQGLGSDEERP